MNTDYFPPAGGVENGRLIVLSNEIGTQLDGFHGARAQTVADETGSMVLGIERSLSMLKLRQALRGRRELDGDADDIFRRDAESVRAAITDDFDALVLAGHSVGGFSVSGMAASGELEVDHIFATDPPGLFAFRPGAEVHRYLAYAVYHEPFRPASQKPSFENMPCKKKPNPIGTFMRSAKEVVVYGVEGAKGLTTGRLLTVAKEQPKTAIDIYLPGMTYSLPAESAARIAQRLDRSLRQMRGEDDAMTRVDFLARRYHSYFNDYQMFAGLLKDSIAANELLVER